MLLWAKHDAKTRVRLCESMAAWSTGVLLGTLTLSIACGPVKFDARDAGEAVEVGIVDALIKVRKAGTATGEVTSGDGKIYCGPQCEHLYRTGDRLELSAVPAPKAHLAGWSSPCDESVEPCAFLVAGDTEVTATFDLTVFDTTVRLIGSGAGTVTSGDGFIDCPRAACGHDYLEESTVVLSAVAAAQSKFLGWRGGGCAGDASSCTVSATVSRTISAEFEAIILSVSRLGEGGGAIVSNPPGIDCGERCEAPFEAGVQVELTASPDLVSRFDGWSGSCSGTGACRIDMSGRRFVSGSFTRRTAPFQNFQEANLVLGQADLISATPNFGGESASSLVQPVDCAADGVHLWVADGSNARVMQWNSPPGFNNAAANLILGQTHSGSHVPVQTTRRGLRLGLSGIAVGEGILYAIDTSNHRVLGWSRTPTVAGQEAYFVLGQDLFTTGDSTTPTPDRFAIPDGGSVSGGLLLLADSGNHRLLIWSTPPTTTLAPADLVLGQPDFASRSDFPVAATSMKQPKDAWFDPGSDRLFVADTDNHRVLVWRGIPTTSGAPADYVLGQTGFENGLRDAGGSGPSRFGFYSPTSVLVLDGNLIVSDYGNNRVLIWAGIPDASFVPPDAVLGQPDFDSRDSGEVSGQTFAGPRGICSMGSDLFVTDRSRCRVLRFTMQPR